MRVPSIVLASLIATLHACGEAPAPRPAEELLVCTEALFRPTGEGATVQWVSAEPVVARVSWGLAPDGLDHDLELACDGPADVVLDGMPAASRVYYRLAVRRPDEATLRQRPVHSFHTARARGEEYRVGFIADTHVNALPFLPLAGSNQAATVRRCLDDELDFVVFLGDEAGVHFYGDTVETLDAAVADDRWRDWRQAYAPLLEEVPGFLTLGNHEGESGYYRALQLDEGVLRLQRWGTVARKRYLLNPDASTYPEGGEDEGWRDPEHEGPPARHENASPLQNYYAWTWGDALFVVLDVQRYTEAEPLGVDLDRPGTEVRLGVEDWTLGEAQLAWLERTLAGSDAKHKLLFQHHLLGGWGYGLQGLDPDAPYKYGRGGARYARVGEQARVTELMHEHGARFVFYGHDHVFAHQETEGLHFVCCGRPSFMQPNWWRGPGWREAYGSRRSRDAREFLATVGYTRVTLGPERVVIEYVRTAVQPMRGENVDPGPDGVVYRWEG